VGYDVTVRFPAMAITTTMPLEEYLRTSFEHDCEWVDGEVRERAMPDDDHSALQAFFIVYFAALSRELNVRVRPELRLHVSARRYRIPDVLLMPESSPRQPVPDTPPLLCIEIVLPDDRPGDLREKLDDYLAMGVGAIWVIDPRRRKLSTVDAEGTHQVESFKVPGSSYIISAAEIFAELEP
jgi:Uma2 family endonuclease